jgi:hypothetical protein
MYADRAAEKIEITKHMFYGNKKVHTSEPRRSSSEEAVAISPSWQPSSCLTAATSV